MSLAKRETVKCKACGKPFQAEAVTADRQFQCSACREAALLRTRPSPDPPRTDDSYDLAEEPVEKMPAVNGPPISALEVLEHLGHAHVSRKRVEPSSEELAAERQRAAVMGPAPIREVVIPIVLIAVGLVLSYCEVMYATRQPLHTTAEAMTAVILKAVLSMGLSVGGIFLATSVFDVCIIGTFQRSILRICAIGVAPSALYGILCHAAGDLNGSLVGVLASIIAYGLLFFFLLKLDLKDTSICVLVTWILITAVNYAAYRFQGASRNSWI